MSRTTKFRFSLWLVALPLFLSNSALADPPVVVPVKYHATFVGPLPNTTATWLWGMNDLGVAVGKSQFPDHSGAAVRWTMAAGLEDMNSLSTLWFDLETNTYVEGWKASWGRDINNSGQITGKAVNGTLARAFFYDERTGFWLLPRLGTANNQANHINEYGEIQGYDYSGAAFIWTPDYPNAVAPITPPAADYGIGTNTFLAAVQSPSSSNLYSFNFVGGSLVYSLISTLNTGLGTSYSNDNGAFSYLTDSGKTLWLSRIGYSPLKISSSKTYTHDTGRRINNSCDVLYHLNTIPYLYRFSERKSYKLYDISDSYTKSTLFVDSSGRVIGGSGIQNAGISSDNVAQIPASDPFDTMFGDVVTGADSVATVVLTPMAK
jgi:hypothetical protein